MHWTQIPAQLLERLPLTGSRRLRRTAAAVCLALATMLLVWALSPRAAGSPVLVVSSALAPGVELSASDLEIRTYPPELVPDDALTAPEEAVGRTTAAHLTVGTPLTAHGLVQPRTEPVAEGQLLMPITVTDEAAASSLQPGHHVRIFSAAAESAVAASGDDIPGPASGSAAGGARAVVDRAVVASVSQNSTGGLTGGTTVVTLLVSEDQAALLAAAAPLGLSFALLN